MGPKELFTRENLRRYGFAAVVAGVLAAMTLLVLAKSVVGGKPGGGAGAPGASQQQSLAMRAGPNGRPGAGGGEMPTVEVAPVAPHVFADSIQALGTAQSRESVTIAAKLTDVIRAIRFDSGDHVKNGQVLVELANVEQQADLKEARAQLEVDRRAYLRFKELYDKGFSPKAKLDEAEAAQARSQAQVEALQSHIEDRTIRAPFAGVMGLRTASPGMLASPGTPIGTLDDTSIIKLDFDVPEPQLSKMRPGAALVARTAAYPNVEFDGRIDEVDSRINPNTRTVRVRALLPNPMGRLKPGMLMTVEVRSNPVTSLAAPEIALIEEADAAYLYRIVKKGPAQVAEKVKVTLGRRKDGLVEVLAGLSEGDLIVVEGVQRVRPGQPVRAALQGVVEAQKFGAGGMPARGLD
jgi:membrane fusion protein (multidrug efflux system)